MINTTQAKDAAMSTREVAKPPSKEQASGNRPESPSASHLGTVKVFVDSSTLSVRQQAISRVKSSGIFKAPPSKIK